MTVEWCLYLVVSGVGKTQYVVTTRHMVAKNS